MPYINRLRRGDFEEYTKVNLEIETTGDLNYLITSLLLKYKKQHGLSYTTINDVSGAMNEALAEFRRRVVVPYEDKKIKENGDIYEG